MKYHSNINYSMMTITATKLRRSEQYGSIDSPLYTIIMFILPFVFVSIARDIDKRCVHCSSLIMMNSTVIKEVHKTRKRHQDLNVEDTQKKQELMKEIKTSIMLVRFCLFLNNKIHH